MHERRRPAFQGWRGVAPVRPLRTSAATNMLVGGPAQGNAYAGCLLNYEPCRSRVPRNSMSPRPSGYKPDVTAGHRTCTMQRPRRCTTQFRCLELGVPRNALRPADLGDFGFRWKVAPRSQPAYLRKDSNPWLLRQQKLSPILGCERLRLGNKGSLRFLVERGRRLGS
jgi:hypothetical protein